jgi:hypothetical protein
MTNTPLLVLRWAMHATACGLLLLATVAVLREGQVAEAAGGALLGLVYAAGPAIQGRPVPGRVWLVLLTAGWVVLAVTAPPFVWLAFPLLFAYLHMLPLWAAMFGVSAMTSVAILAAGWHAGELTVPLVLGPGVAAVVVTLLALACRALRTQGEHRRS